MKTEEKVPNNDLLSIPECLPSQTSYFPTKDLSTERCQNISLLCKRHFQCGFCLSLLFHLTLHSASFKAIYTLGICTSLAFLTISLQNFPFYLNLNISILLISVVL